MSFETITMDKWDSEEFSIILRNANASYEMTIDGENVNFHIDEDESMCKWLKKLAYDLHVGHIRVPYPSVENYNSFMDALDSYELEIVGTKYTWFFGEQYIIKGHEKNLSAFCRHLKNLTKQKD